VAGFAEWQMQPAVAAGLERLGWRADEPEVRDVVPAVLRGGNVVAVLPPAPSWSSPIVAGLLGQLPAADGSVLVLAAPGLVGEWAVTIGALVEATELQVDVLREPAGSIANRTLCRGDVVVASPETALACHGRSALHPERFRAILLAWPEQWQADDAVTALLQDFPRDAQRVVLTARRDQLDGAAGVVERYARKALVVTGAAAEAAPATTRASSVRTVPTSWAGRAATIAGVLDALNAPQATIWTADRRDHQLIQRALGSLHPGLTISARSRPGAGRIVCYDPPSPQQLAELSAVGEVVLLVPPGSEEYVARMAPSRRPMLVTSAANEAVERDAALRHVIRNAIEGGDHAAALYALAPLFEESDPQTIAAALFGLWRTRPAAPASASRVAQPAASGGPASSAVAKIWIGAGKKDEATVADFVAVLVREVGVERSQIGRIELRDTFALVEVPAADAEAIVQRLSGITIRRRKLTARVDQGRGGGKPPERGRSAR
jgi:ATP-dependent RNA helicase DeaD